MQAKCTKDALQVEDFPALFTHPSPGKREALWRLLPCTALENTNSEPITGGILSLCKLSLTILGIDPSLVCHARHPFPSLRFLIVSIRKILQASRCSGCETAVERAAHSKAVAVGTYLSYGILQLDILIPSKLPRRTYAESGR